jgi:hypothetical protein
LPGRPTAGDRGQTVLLAALVIALAMVPLGVAYLQMGIHPDVAAPADEPDGERTVLALERSLADARTDVPATYPWGNRSDAVSVVRTRMQPSIDRLEADGITEGVPRSIAYNETAAGEWADEACPGGPARQFGDCEAIDGVVVQDRVGETHVLAVAFDVQVTTESGTTSLTVVVRVSE